MSGISGTFPDTYGILYMTVNCWRIWGPSRHRHGEIALGKPLARYHDGDDAHDGHLQRFSRRWWRLCLPSQRGLSNISVQSLQSGTGSSGFLDDNLRHHGHLCSDHLSTYGEDTRSFSWAQDARGEVGVLYVGDSGDHGDGLDVVRLRVGMGSGALSHSNIGAHLRATCRTM